MRTPLRRYRVEASRDGEDLGYLLVSATDEAGALTAFWDLREQFEVCPHDLLTKVRVALEAAHLL